MIFEIIAGVAVVGMFVVWKLTDTQIARLNKRHVIELAEARKDAVKRSRSTIEGLVAEQLVPFFPEWKYVPSEARFLASPLDYIVFKGLSKDAVDEIVFVEIKSGQSKTSNRQNSVKKAIENGRVSYELVEVDMNGKPVRQDEIDSWIASAKSGKTIVEVATEFDRGTATIYNYVPSGTFNCSGGLRSGKEIVLSDVDASYLAGIIDGEGSIGLTKIIRKDKSFITPVLTITNTSKLLVDKINTIYPNGIWRDRNRVAGQKLIYEWVLNKVNDVADLLPQLIPYLSIKLDKAKLVLEFCEYRQKKLPYSDKEEEFYIRFKDLK